MAEDALHTECKHTAAWSPYITFDECVIVVIRGFHCDVVEVSIAALGQCCVQLLSVPRVCPALPLTGLNNIGSLFRSVWLFGK